MSRIAETFRRLSQAQRKALIPYVMAGDPDLDTSLAVLLALVEGGADVIELGIPFSDPMADGPVIQRAGERALAQGVGLTQVLQLVSSFRQRCAQAAAGSALARGQDLPVVLMGYANPVERFGVDRFVQEARAAGVDGVLIVDYPPEECVAFAQTLRAADMDLIFLLAPTSTSERVRQVGALASGYVYYVSLKGVTGAGHLDVPEVQRQVQRIRADVQVPVGVGFGIRDGKTAREVAQGADAVVIGSALVQAIEAAGPGTGAALAAGNFMRDIRSALDA